MTLQIRSHRIHRAGIRAMMASDDMVEGMDQIMQLARLYAITIAPVDTGRYVSRFLRQDAVEAGVNPRGNAFARLSNDARDPQTLFCYALALEVGTRHMRAQRILRRALQLTFADLGLQ